MSADAGAPAADRRCGGRPGGRNARRGAVAAPLHRVPLENTMRPGDLRVLGDEAAWVYSLIGPLRTGLRRICCLSTSVTIAQGVGFQNSATGLDLGFYAARSYSLRRPPRTGRRLIRSRERSATG
jgi:hypothetical protein